MYVLHFAVHVVTTNAICSWHVLFNTVLYFAALVMVDILAWQIKSVTDTIFRSSCLSHPIQVTNPTRIVAGDLDISTMNFLKSG